MIRVSHVSKTYDPRSRTASPALHDVSFQLPDRGFVCIVGPSGCGKTSLLNAMGGLDTFDEGRISTDGLDDIRCGSRLTELERSRSFGYIFQNYYLLPDYSAAYNVYLGMHCLDLTHQEKLRRVMDALRAVDMDRYARRAVGELSGGQQQRVAIARAIARRPRVIFADEPTGNLDEANTINICTLLRQISRDSLVIMVTHEQRIARFFADRILTLEAGRLRQDSTQWDRGRMVLGGGNLYAGEFAQSTLEGEGIRLRLLREEGAPPVSLTVVAQRDRILLKLDDERVVTCGGLSQSPALVEGRRPVLEPDQLPDQGEQISWAQDAPPAPAGRGLTPSMMLREAGRLLGGKGLQRLGSWLFLCVLTLLAALTLGDYLKVSSMDPEDFITTDSHILELSFSRGENLDAQTVTIRDLVQDYLDVLEGSGLSFYYLPTVPVSANYTVSTFLQMGSESEALSGFSYAPLEQLPPDSLLYGRLPQRPDEIVVDRWVLESLMAREGILQSGITHVSQFLDHTLRYTGKNYAPTIVGICDSGQPSVYMGREGLISLGSSGTQLITLSQLQELFPGRYDQLTLGREECLVVTNNAGLDYENRVGGVYATNSRVILTIAGTLQEDTYASLVVGEDTASDILRSMLGDRFFLYCPDKQAVKDYLAAGLPPELSGALQLKVTDHSADDYSAYLAATRLQLDGRRIVTFTVLALSLVMLCLLQRSKLQHRVGMVAVYRLLGIPGRKLAAIFALECLLLSLTSALPAAVLTWAVLAILGQMPSLAVPYLLPWYAALGTYLVILAFHLLSSLLPLWQLLRLPPARLAAKYDV